MYRSWCGERENCYVLTSPKSPSSKNAVFNFTEIKGSKMANLMRKT